MDSRQVQIDFISMGASGVRIPNNRILSKKKIIRGDVMDNIDYYYINYYSNYINPL